MSEKVMFVDDDASILAALKRRLRKRFEIETVSGGKEGLELIEKNGPYSVVVSDFRMPRMNGVEFLSEVRRKAPDTVRMMLTGSSDLQAAVRAVNEGNIFRFLTKPCPVEVLAEAVSSGIQAYRKTAREQAYHRKTRNYLAQATVVQRGLMPKDAPRIDGLDIAGKSIFLDETSGDYYDFFEKGDPAHRRVAVAVGDVSDHGVPSALLMSSARGMLRERACRSDGVGDIVQGLNRQLARDVDSSHQFMTLFYCEIDPREPGLRWVSAGHDPALLYNGREKSFDELGGRGLPLGIFEDSCYEESRRRLSSGECILIATDGIWEARNPGGRMFGKENLRRLMREHAGEPAADVVAAVTGALAAFIHPLKIQDDATLVVVRVE
jgi:serine phosphatase RsbU (regulator of sigma subunit)